MQTGVPAGYPPCTTTTPCGDALLRRVPVARHTGGVSTRPGPPLRLFAPQEPSAAAARLLPPDCQDAHVGGHGVQDLHRPAHHLPPQRPQLRRELPAYDVCGCAAWPPAGRLLCPLLAWPRSPKRAAPRRWARGLPGWRPPSRARSEASHQQNRLGPPLCAHPCPPPQCPRSAMRWTPSWPRRWRSSSSCTWTTSRTHPPPPCAPLVSVGLSPAGCGGWVGGGGWILEALGGTTRRHLG